MLVAFVAVMTVSSSGLLDLVLPESCAPVESGSPTDQDCPATCVRCNCCAQGIEILSVDVTSRFIPMVNVALPVRELVQQGSPSDILHVPRILAS